MQTPSGLHKMKKQAKTDLTKYRKTARELPSACLFLLPHNVYYVVLHLQNKNRRSLTPVAHNVYYVVLKIIFRINRSMFLDDNKK